MIASKVAGVLLVTALTVALSRLPPWSRSRYNSLSRRLMNHNHYHQSPNVVIPPDVEFPEYRKPRGQSDIDNEINLVPKRSGEHQSGVQFQTVECLCTEVEGVYEVGDKHWPHNIAGRECKRKDGRTNLNIEISSSCVAYGTKWEEFSCENVAYPLFLLTKGNAAILSETENALDHNTFPEEIHPAWTFELFNVNVSCRFTRN